MRVIKVDDLLKRIKSLEHEVKTMKQEQDAINKEQNKQQTIIVSPPEMPVINLEPQITIQSSVIPAPVVNVPVNPVDITMALPETEETITVQRNNAGFIQSLVKRIRRK